MSKKLFGFFLLVIFAAIIGACATSNIFESIGENISAPNGIAIDSANQKLYLINSNSTVLYKWEEGSIQIYDLTNPEKPTLERTVDTVSFSGDAFFDQTRNLLYTSNRYSESSSTDEDQLLVMNADSGSAYFLSVRTSPTKKDPFGLACCYPNNATTQRMWIATEDDVLEYKDFGDLNNSDGTIELKQPLSNGSELTEAESSFIAINGAQAYLSRTRGGLMVVNLDEAGDTSKNALDYFINDIENPQGVATDGTYVYVVDEDHIDNEWSGILRVLDLSSLTPLTNNTETTVLSMEDDNLLVESIIVGKEPETVFLTTDYAFVSSKEEDLISVVNLNNQTKIKDIEVGEEPFSMALYAPGGVEQYLYVGNIVSNTLSIIDLSTLKVEATYP